MTATPDPLFAPVPGMAELMAEFDRFNALQVQRLCAGSGLRYLGADGPVYLAGAVRIRGTFVDPAGAHCADARLVVESAFLQTPAFEYFSNEVTALLLDHIHELWIADRNRGVFEAAIAPIPLITAALGLPEPEPFPDGWCRGWTTLPSVADSSMLALTAAGWGEPPIWNDDTDHSGKGPLT